MVCVFVLPLPTRLRRYCNPALLVILKIYLRQHGAFCRLDVSTLLLCSTFEKILNRKGIKVKYRPFIHLWEDLETLVLAQINGTFGATSHHLIQSCKLHTRLLNLDIGNHLLSNVNHVNNNGTSCTQSVITCFALL